LGGEGIVTHSEFYTLRDNLRTLRDVLPRLHQDLGLRVQGAQEVWQERLLHNVLPAIDFDLPVLLVAICGGGSTGKSTLFNTLVGMPLSNVGFKAGLTRRVLLTGHPAVLSGPSVAQSLLHRLRETPVPWTSPDETTAPGPPLYALSPHLSRNLLLIDTPDFDTGYEGRLLNRELAEPILRTSEVIVYVFTNTVYNNLSNTRFMADVVGGIGGRPIVLVYRISRVASDREVLEHCAVVARRLYGRPDDASGYPEMVMGIYRMHESDAVAQGDAPPALVPLGDLTRGRPLTELLAGLDVARIKRHVFGADLRAIHEGASEAFAAARAEAQRATHYRQALQHALAESALEALRAFPANEAVALTTRIFLETSPGYIRFLRNTGRVAGAPFRGLQWLGSKLANLTGLSEPTPEEAKPTLDQDLLLAANALRNRLMDDALIVRAGSDDSLLQSMRQAQRHVEKGSPPVDVVIEPLGDHTYNLHFPAPLLVQQQEQALLGQDWEAISAELKEAARSLVGLPPDIEAELHALVLRFRDQMSWHQHVREAFFASLSALPPILGVTYTLLTADPVSGGGMWIQLQSLFGINDLWALVSIPASAGLSEQERKQLEKLIAPVFRLWLDRRLAAIVDVYRRTVCRPVVDALQALPQQDDPRFGAVVNVLSALEEMS
jgi:hypothetical protein